MKWYVVKEGSLVKLDEILTKNNQVALTAWKAVNKIDIGTWVLNFESSSGLGLKLGKINYNGYEGTDWNKITDLEWVDITEVGGLDFVLFLRYDKLEKKPVTVPINPENWMYKIYIKTKDESGEGLQEDVELVYSVEFCSKRVFTKGPNKILGARCPFDPETGKYMEQCLNWRRTDQVGKECMNIMDAETKKKSIYNFCRIINDNAADCKCFNRRIYSDYLRRKDYERDPDHCWYAPCKSGSYLLDKENEMEQCNGRNCIISYNNSNTGGNVNLDNNTSYVNCFNLENPPTTSEYSTKKVIVILLILLVLFLF